MVDLSTVDLSIFLLVVDTMVHSSLTSMLNWSRRFFSLRLRFILHMNIGWTLQEVRIIMHMDIGWTLQEVRFILHMDIRVDCTAG